jgi:hypothetical protein
VIDTGKAMPISDMGDKGMIFIAKLRNQINVPIGLLTTTTFMLKAVESPTGSFYWLLKKY